MLFRSTARSWRIAKIWRTTHGAIGTLLGGEPPTVPVRLWGRHLVSVRERTVLDNHLQRWLHAFWERPLHAAVAATMGAVRQELLPEPGEGWRDKLTRAGHALRHPGTPLSAHARGWREAASRRRRDDQPPE